VLLDVLARLADLRCFETEGLFRVPGDHNDMNDLKVPPAIIPLHTWIMAHIYFSEQSSVWVVAVRRRPRARHSSGRLWRPRLGLAAQALAALA
jgi:hypothetical protein